MKQLTIVYQIENQDHQTALLCAPNILRVSHSDSILELTKAAGLAQAQQNEIENLNRGAALLRERLAQSEKSRKAAQIENEQLKERIAHGDRTLKEKASKLATENIKLQAMIDSIGAGGVESLRKNECLHQILESQHSAKYPPINPEDFDSDSDLCHYFYAWKHAKAGRDSGEKWRWACEHIQRMMRAYVDASSAIKAAHGITGKE